MGGQGKHVEISVLAAYTTSHTSYDNVFLRYKKCYSIVDLHCTFQRLICLPSAARHRFFSK